MKMARKINDLKGSKFDASGWASSAKSEGARGTIIGSTTDRMQYGRLYSFNYYDPKTRDKLAYWNTNPLIIKIDESISVDEGPMDIGVNLNFFPEKIKYQFIDAFWTRYGSAYNSKRNTPAKDQSYNKFSPKSFMATYKPYGIGFATRKYINKRISNSYVFSNNIDVWASAMLINNPNFVKLGEAERDKLFIEYINKTR